MPFRFNLDAVLRFRENAERAAEAALYGVMQAIAKVELDLRQLEVERARLRDEREQELARTLRAYHLAEIAEWERELGRVADKLGSEQQQLEIQRLEQLAIYQKAHQDREVLSGLREQRLHAYDLDQRRQEQRILDELFLARWNHPD